MIKIIAYLVILVCAGLFVAEKAFSVRVGCNYSKVWDLQKPNSHEFIYTCHATNKHWGRK